MKATINTNTMLHIPTTTPILDTVAELVSNCENKKAIALLRKETGFKCFYIKYTPCKYTPKGYGEEAILFANTGEEDEKIFSYFLANANRGWCDIYCW